MDITEELLLSLLGGVGQGTAKAATLGTTAAARALWKRLRDQFRRRKGSLSDAERATLDKEPGDPVDADVLRGLLQKLTEAERGRLRIYQTRVEGDWVSEGGVKVEGDWVSDGGIKNVFNLGATPDG